VRDGDVLLADFYTLNLHDYTLKQFLLPPGKSWWQGLEDAHDGIILLHGYGDRKLGQHKEIKAYAANSHLLQWEMPEHTFYGVARDGILAFATASPETGLVMLSTDRGEVSREGISQQQAAELVQQFTALRHAACIYPVNYLAGEPYFNEVKQFIAHELKVEPVRALEYAESSDFIVVSYYLQNSDTKLDNYLVVFNTDGRLVLKECLGVGLSGLGSDTFIIFNQNLYFLQYKDILKVYKLF
jgi:hypothetical protein